MKMGKCYLLLISNGEDQHYCWVKNMSRLLTPRVREHDHGRYICKVYQFKLTRVELEFLIEGSRHVAHVMMFDRGIQGGVSLIPTRHGKANNLYIGHENDSNLSIKYIPYLDANNVYCWAMSKPLPTHGFKWMIE